MFAFLSTTNPHTNLGTEECLLQKIDSIGPTLLLYVNEPCVVMGKHQNPLLECDSAFLQQRNIPLLRRFTGGGTVFHDLGNLNFSFLMPKTQYNETLHFSVIQTAILELGIESSMDAHKSLWYKGRKFSGSAFARKLVGNIHHGTLLVHSNLETLTRTLVPENENLQTKAPRSRRAPVLNLSEVVPSLTLAAVANSLHVAFAKTFPQNATPLNSPICEAELAPFVEKHRSYDWVFGSTPTY